MQDVKPDEPRTDARICDLDASRIGDLIRIGDETNLNAWSAKNYLDELQLPEAIMLRSVSDTNETIGFIVGRLVPGGVIEHVTDAEIYNLAVIEGRQGRGFGQQLFNAFLTRCLDRGVWNIWLEVRDSNEKAIRFYQRNGFEEVQSRKNFYDNPREHARLMKLVLKKNKA